MFPKINQLIVNLLLNFDSIPEDRKLVLNDLASKIRSELNSKELLNLLFICTHNSRRSHMGQIWGTIAARYFDLPLFSFSAGTEITALHPNVIQMLINEGFEVKSLKDVYNLDDPIVCFSSKFLKIEKEVRFFLRSKMYNNKKVLLKNNHGKKIINKLFYKIKNKPKKFLNDDQLKNDPNRAIADFISGMTDRYAINLNKGI